LQHSRQSPAEDVVWGGSYTWTQVSVNSVSAKTLLKMCDIRPVDKVKIKCDIEGAEFIFLRDLLNCEDLSSISEIMIEWHERFCYPDHEAKALEKKEIIRLLTERGILVRYWD
jgi:hypothetical protein